MLYFRARELLASLKKTLLARGTKGVIGLGKLFKIIDDDNSKTLDFTEFKKVCKDFRLKFNDEEVQILFNEFDRDKNGSLEYDEFLRTIRVKIHFLSFLFKRVILNPRRLALVNKTFDKMDANNNGTIEIDDLRGITSIQNLIY